MTKPEITLMFVRLEHEGAVARITLNRPEKFNSFCREMALELQKILEECGADDSVRCVYISGEGKAFCAGQDLAEAIEDNGIELAQIVAEHYNPIIRLLRSIEKPVLCAVNGVAAGAGANIALSGDVVVATASASFIQAFSKIGLIPDSGGTFFLPRLIGLQRASALMMLGEKVSAAEAEAMGMIFRHFADEEFSEKSLQLAHTLAAMPTKGIGLTKRLLNESFTNNLDAQLDREGAVQVEAAKSADYREGVQAFLEKRKPVFKGC